MLIQRDAYLEKLIDRVGNGLVKVITGPRRCGKSFLLFNIFKSYLLEKGVPEDHIIEAVLDDEEHEELLDRHALGEYIRSRIADKDRYYVFLDEIQEVDGFERVLNGISRIGNADIYVTGSNSTLLSSEIADIFKDRGDEIRVHPLSFSEFTSVHPGSRSEAWDDYMIYGGMPRVLYYSKYEDKADYLTKLFERTYLSDIIRRHRIRKHDELDELTDILASAVGSLTNPSKLERTFRSVKNTELDHQTIRQYIGYLEDAFLVDEAKRYDIKGKKYISTPSKYYFEDVGLRNARLNFRQIEETHLMENILYNELCIRGYKVDVGIVEKYGKENGVTTKKIYEIDFVVNRGSKRYYIQSALDISSEDKEEREKRGLIEIDDSFKRIIVVRDDIKARYNEQGIMIIGLWNFLLDRHSLEL